MRKYSLTAIARTVILTDYKTATLFTAWKPEDIEEEVKEHFPDGDPDMFVCDYQKALHGWPTYPFANVQVREHVIPYAAVSHLLPTLEVINGS